MLQTFEDTHYRRVTYVPSGTTRYAEFFDAVADPRRSPWRASPVVLDIPSSARPAAPLVLDAVPLLRWEQAAEPDEPFAWRQVRRSGVRVWLARPWFSSGDGELLGVLVFDPDEWVQAGRARTWTRQPKAQQAPDGATSLWAARPDRAARRRDDDPTVPPLLTFDQLVLDTLETASAARRRHPAAARRRGASVGATAAGRTVPATRSPSPARSRCATCAGIRRCGCWATSPSTTRPRGAGSSTSRCRRPRRCGRSCAWRSRATSRTRSRVRALAGRADRLGPAAAHPDADREPAGRRGTCR